MSPRAFFIFSLSVILNCQTSLAQTIRFIEKADSTILRLSKERLIERYNNSAKHISRPAYFWRYSVSWFWEKPDKAFFQDSIFLNSIAVKTIPVKKECPAEMNIGKKTREHQISGEKDCFFYPLQLWVLDTLLNPIAMTETVSHRIYDVSDDSIGLIYRFVKLHDRVVFSLHPDHTFVNERYMGAIDENGQLIFFDRRAPGFSYSAQEFCESKWTDFILD